MTQIANVLYKKMNNGISRSPITTQLHNSESDEIILRCPRSGKDFTLDQMESSHCPYCKDWIDVNTLILLKNLESRNKVTTQAFVAFGR